METKQKQIISLQKHLRHFVIYRKRLQQQQQQQRRSSLGLDIKSPEAQRKQRESEGSLPSGVPQLSQQLEQESHVTVQSPAMGDPATEASL